MKNHKKLLTFYANAYIIELKIMQTHKTGGVYMYPNLKAELVKNKIPQKTVADILEIDNNSANIKINKGHFTVEQAFKLKAALFPWASLEYLFERVDNVTAPAV